MTMNVRAIIISFPNSLHKQVRRLYYILTNSHNLKIIYCVIRLFLETVKLHNQIPLFPGIRARFQSWALLF